MAPPKSDQPHDLSAAISAALDDLIGPLTPEYVEERPIVPLGVVGMRAPA